MEERPHLDHYISTTLQRGFFVRLEVANTFSIKSERRNRCLSPIGESLLSNAIQGYLAGRRAEADELVAKAHSFLKLAHSIGEKQRYSYSEHFSESRRSAALAYVHWLFTGEADDEMLEDARTHLTAYDTQAKDLDRAVLTLAVPELLYTESYPLILWIADRLNLGLGEEGRRKTIGLAGNALRIALAPDESARDVEKVRLREKLPKQLFQWINTGHYINVAYMLHAVFPKPEGPPRGLIEGCWNSIPDKLIIF